MTWQPPEGGPVPDPTAPTTPSSLEATAPAPDAPSTEGPVPAPSTGLISAAPVGWAASEPAGASGAADGPLVAWAPPAEATAVTVREGLVISGVFARVVAYSVDILLLTCLEAIVSGLLGQYGDQPSTSLALVVSVVFIGVDFLYFVGFWTSGWQGTVGMRLLRLRVLGAVDAGTLSLSGALIRWLVLTGGIAILSLIPGVGRFVGLLSILWLLVLLVSTGTDRLRQGLHDRWAGSVVVQPAGSGAGLALFTCAVLVLLVGVGLPLFVLAVAGDQLRDILSQIGNSI